MVYRVRSAEERRKQTMKAQAMFAARFKDESERSEYYRNLGKASGKARKQLSEGRCPRCGQPLLDG